MTVPDPLYTLLRDTSLELIRHRSLPELLPDILRRAQEFVGADVAYMALRDEKGDVMRVAYYRGTLRTLPEDYFIRRGEGVSGQAWATGRVVVTEDYLNYGNRLPEPYWGSMRAAMGAPLFVNGAVWGALILAHTAPGKKYSALEIDGTEQLANFASLAIENARILDTANAEIARRKEIEATMRRNEIRYRTVLAESATPMCSADPDSLQLLEVTRSFLQLFGYSLRKALTLTLYDLAPYAQDTVDHICKEALPERKILPPLVITACRADGEAVEMELRLQLIHDVDQTIIFILFRDLTEQRENKFLTVLQDTTMDLLRRRRWDDLLRALLDRCLELAMAPCGFIWLVDGDGAAISPYILAGFDAGKEWTSLQKGQGVVGKVWESGEPLVVDDYTTWPDHLGFSSSKFLFAVVGFPLLDSAGAVVGVIGLADTRMYREFDRREVQYLGQMARLASLSLLFRPEDGVS